MEYVAKSYINKGVFLGGGVFQQNWDVILAIASRNAFIVNAFDEHPLCLALHHLEVFGLVFERNLPHCLAAFRLDFFGHLVGQSGGLGAGAHRLFERVDVAEADFAGEVAAFLEGLFGFAREAHDDVGGEVEVGARGFDALA